MLILISEMKRMHEVHELMEKGKKDAGARLQNANSQIHAVHVSNDDVEKMNSHTMSMAARMIISPMGQTQYAATADPHRPSETCTRTRDNA